LFGRNLPFAHLMLQEITSFVSMICSRSLNNSDREMLSISIEKCLTNPRYPMTLEKLVMIQIKYFLRHSILISLRYLKLSMRRRLNRVSYQLIMKKKRKWWIHNRYHRIIYLVKLLLTLENSSQFPREGIHSSHHQEKTYLRVIENQN